MKYRKVPAIIEAVQWHGFEEGPHDLGIVPYASNGTGWIDTLEGGHIVTPGDGIKDEKYTCKPDIFVATYELEEDSDG